MDTSALTIEELLQNVVEANVMSTLPDSMVRNQSGCVLGDVAVPMEDDAEDPMPSVAKMRGEASLSDLVDLSELGADAASVMGDSVMASLKSMVEAMNKEGRKNTEEEMETQIHGDGKPQTYSMLLYICMQFSRDQRGVMMLYC